MRTASVKLKHSAIAHVRQGLAAAYMFTGWFAGAHGPDPASAATSAPSSNKSTEVYGHDGGLFYRQAVSRDRAMAPEARSSRSECLVLLTPRGATDGGMTTDRRCEVLRREKPRAVLASGDLRRSVVAAGSGGRR